MNDFGLNLILLCGCELESECIDFANKLQNKPSFQTSLSFVFQLESGIGGHSGQRVTTGADFGKGYCEDGKIENTLLKAVSGEQVEIRVEQTNVGETQKNADGFCTTAAVHTASAQKKCNNYKVIRATRMSAW